MPLTDLDDWIDFAEALLGRVDYDDQGLRGAFTSLPELSDFEDHLPTNMGMEHFSRVGEQFPWGQQAIDIAKEQNFFHWELQFANVFKDGGFDLQVGNPPWVRPDWSENLVLAEIEPRFALTVKPSSKEFEGQRIEVLEGPEAKDFYLAELARTKAVAKFTGDVATYEILSETRPDFYRCFMKVVWSHSEKRGIVGLVHPSAHLNGKREGKIREAAYQHLQLHAHFVNTLKLFDIEPTEEFGIHIYGSGGIIDFGDWSGG